MVSQFSIKTSWVLQQHKIDIPEKCLVPNMKSITVGLMVINK